MRLLTPTTTTSAYPFSVLAHVTVPGNRLAPHGFSRCSGHADRVVPRLMDAVGGGAWVDATLGEPAVFGAPGQDLRLEAVFDVRDPEPLTAKGVVIEMQGP